MLNNAAENLSINPGQNAGPVELRSEESELIVKNGGGGGTAYCSKV